MDKILSQQQKTIILLEERNKELYEKAIKLSKSFKDNFRTYSLNKLSPECILDLKGCPSLDLQKSINDLIEEEEKEVTQWMYF